jgi:hypothetical protein
MAIPIVLHPRQAVNRPRAVPSDRRHQPNVDCLSRADRAEIDFDDQGLCARGPDAADLRAFAASPDWLATWEKVSRESGNPIAASPIGAGAIRERRRLPSWSALSLRWSWDSGRGLKRSAGPLAAQLG